MCNRSSLLRKLTDGIEAQRKEEERQAGEVTEALKRFMVQEMARGFSLFEEALLHFEPQNLSSTQSLQQPFKMQSSAIMSSMMSKKKKLLPRHHWIIFFQEGRQN